MYLDMLFGDWKILFIILFWMYIGFELKFLDQVVDEDRPLNKVVTYAMIAFTGFVAGFFMVGDSFTGGAGLSLIFGMVLANKIDNRLWVIQVTAVVYIYILFLAYSFSFLPGYTFDWISIIITFIFVMVFAIMDEVVHDMGDKINNKLLKKFLDHRPILDGAIFFMAFVFPFMLWYHAVGFLLFDAMYDLTAYLWKNGNHGKTEEKEILE